uniref:C-type lectin mannose-binding isoform-like n=1 Tax=Styela clava TaxID=7725 RepID=UPI00193A49AC|nr:C-type lectin mannose-binding isoform-like [Styela clava]
MTSFSVITIVVLLIHFILGLCDIPLDTCTLSCGNKDSTVRDALVHQMVGPPGKRGPPGPPGNAQSTCNCPKFRELENRIDALEKALVNKEFGRERLIKEEWTKIGAHYYKLFKTKLPYKAAKTKCESNGARLASTGYHDSSVRRDLVDRLIKPSNYNTWIGLDDLENVGKYIWSDGVSSTSENTEWGQNEPSSKNERCAHSYSLKNWLLNDASCSSDFYFLCEI